jgi:hypothetical protein
MRYTQNINLPIVEDNDLYSKEINNLAFEKIDEEIQGLADIVETLDSPENGIADVKKDISDIKNDVVDINEQLDTNTKQLNGTGVNINNYNYIDDINERISTALSENDHIIIPEGEYNINGFEIPKNKIVECVGNIVFNTTGTIMVGVSSSFIGVNTTVYATSVNLDDFSIVKLSKKCIVRLKRITGYKKSGESKGASTVAKGIDATHSDFVNVEIGDITQCKYAFYINGGDTGSGLTINDSVFKARWIGDCYYGFYQAGNSQTHIYTEAYIEYCNVGYSLQGSFYGRHYATFDSVDLYFENRNTSWRTRLGEVYIPNFTASQLFSNVDRYFEATTFHMKDCVILSKAQRTPNIISPVDSKIYMQSGNASLRLTSDSSITNEGKKSTNDTSNGCTITIGDGGYSDFVVEKSNGDILFRVSTSGGGTRTRNGLTVGDSSVGYGHLTLSKGCLVFGEKIYNSVTNAPNNSIFIDYSDNKLKFKDSTGTIKNIQLSE